MKVESRLIFEKYLRLRYILMYRNPWMIFMSSMGLIMLVFSILYFLGFNQIATETPYYPLVFGLIVVVFLPYSVFRSAKKNFQTNGRLQEKIVYDFSGDRIKIIGESFSSELDWGKTYKVIERKDWILIYQDKIVANIIPKESFGDRLEEFKRIVREKNIKSNFKK
jgi:hypothetical protein